LKICYNSGTVFYDIWLRFVEELMRITFTQELKQEQKQILSQRMIQSMEILQLPLMELQERIEEEMSQNPLLEFAEDSPEENFEEEGAVPVATDDSGILKIERETEIAVGESPNNQDDFRIADEYASTYDDTINEAPARSQNWLEGEEERRNDVIANIACREITLQEHLIEQLGWFDLDDDLRSMIERIIYNLDSNGFLLGSIEEILGPKAKPSEKTLAQKALEVVHKLDPTGVGASGIQECLLMQLTPDMPNFDLVKTLITDHLEDLEKNRLPLISRKTGYPIRVIQEAILEIRKLNPRPGAGFSDQITQVVIPDIFVEKNEQGCYVIRIEEGNIPPLRISKYYRELMKQRETDKQTRDYIRQKVGAAQWLIDSIKQRQSTIAKVASAIVEHQTDFLERGVEAIKPLKMQQVAEKIGVHVTTVSRACDDKWMQTPQGVFPLKRFFVSSVHASEGEEYVAQDAVRVRLQQIIEKEDKSKPYSDEDLVKLLDQSGFKVARRTVVKYRQLMHIPSSRERRNWAGD